MWCDLLQFHPRPVRLHRRICLSCSLQAGRAFPQLKLGNNSLQRCARSKKLIGSDASGHKAAQRSSLTGLSRQCSSSICLSWLPSSWGPEGSGGYVGSLPNLLFGRPRLRSGILAVRFQLLELGGILPQESFRVSHYAVVLLRSSSISAIRFSDTSRVLCS